MKVTFLYCQSCGNKFLLDESVVELKVNDIPGGIPYVDKEDGKVKMPPQFPRRRLFRCTKCGKGVASKLLTMPSNHPTVISERNGLG